jgi:DNA repair photolyase
MISITGTDEAMRLKLEPRTATYKQRFNIIQQLTQHQIPCGVMVAPIIPGINNHQIPNVIRQAAQAGATKAGYTIARLNGAVGPIFKDWLLKNFPDRADKVWHQICETHGGKVSDSRLGVRMRGQGKLAENINQLFILSKTRFMKEQPVFKFNTSLFNHKLGDSQLSLF